MVIGAEYLLNVATAIGTTAIQAGVILSLTFTMGLILIILVSTRGRKPQITMPIGALFPTILFTFMGWYPIWVGSALALVLSIFIGYVFSRW